MDNLGHINNKWIYSLKLLQLNHNYSLFSYIIDVNNIFYLFIQSIIEGTKIQEFNIEAQTYSNLKNRERITPMWSIDKRLVKAIHKSLNNAKHWNLKQLLWIASNKLLGLIQQIF